MNTVQTAVTWGLGIALATTLLLPERQTVPVAREVFGGLRGLLATVMGTGKKV